MHPRVDAFVALLIAAAITVVAAAGVAAWTVLEPVPADELVSGPMPRTDPTSAPLPTVEPGAVLADRSGPARTEVAGMASNYPGTAGWIGEATVALLIAAAVTVVASAGVAAWTVLEPAPSAEIGRASCRERV